jgi:hypothetical protein
MEMILPALAVACAALCIWLTVRIVNRRERWAKWTLAVVAALPMLYVVSFGPACWWLSKAVYFPSSADRVLIAPAFYTPIGRCAQWAGDGKIRSVIDRYATLGIAQGEAVCCGAFEIDDPGIVFNAPDL